VGADNVNPHEDLKRLDEQISLATELAALKPLYFRLNEIIQAFPGDFEVQFAGNEIKQHLMERGTLLKHLEALPPAPPTVTPITKTSSPPTLFPDPFAASPPTRTGPLGVSDDTPTTPITYSSEDLAPPPLAPPPLAPPPPAAKITGTFPEPASPPAWVPVPPPPPQKGKPIFTRAVVIVPIAMVLVLALGAGAFLMYQTRKRNALKAAIQAAAVPVDVSTTPAGASVKLAPTVGAGKETDCTSNCKVALTAGSYQVSATLDGYEAATGTLTVTPGQSATAVSLTLQAQAQSVRLLTDLPQGKVVVDDKPPADLQDGQLVIDKVAPGTHTVKISGPSGNAAFSFEIADARLPAVSGPVTAQNMIAVLVSSFGKQARIVTNAGPWKLAVNGQSQSDAGPAGTDLTSFQPGVNEIVVGDGKDQRNMSETFGAAPMLTAFLKTDVNAGTLIVSVGQDDVHVFLNDKESRSKTQRGQLRVQLLGKVTVRVSKPGFLDAPPQTVEVKKGAEVRLQFDLKPQPQFGSLQIRGAAPGTEVVIDQKSAGVVGPDGTFSLSAIQPGDHTVELRRDQFAPKRLQRSFQAGQAVVLAASDVELTAANGTIRINRTPATATITYRRGDETEAHEARGAQLDLPPGSYTFSASAPGFTGATTRVQLAAGENREVGFALTRERPAPPPPIVSNGMDGFEDQAAWKKDGDTWVHKGAGFLAYKLPPKGIFTFTVDLVKGGGRSGQIRWCLQYVDAKNYLLYEIDRKTFWAGVIEKGKRLERVKAPHNLGNPKSATIQIEVMPDHLTEKVLVNGDWKLLDTFVEAGRDFTQGKFGFLIQGNDEIAISDFKFLPR